MQEVEAPKNYEIYRRNPFRPFQEHRRHTKSTRITTKNEHRRSWKAGNYENLQTKPVHAGRRHPKTTKIHRRNEHASTKPRNSDEICARPVRHLDLATPAFYHYRKNPKCYTLFGEQIASSSGSVQHDIINKSIRKTSTFLFPCQNPGV